MASQPAFTFGLDWLDRPIITSAKATTALINPLEGLHSRARRDIILSPLSREERRLMKMSRSLPFEERRVVMHWMLVSRTEGYIRDQKLAAEKASRDRAADIVEDERRRSERYATWQAKQAGRDNDGGVALNPKPNKPGRPAATMPSQSPATTSKRVPASTSLPTPRPDPEPEAELEDDYER